MIFHRTNKIRLNYLTTSPPLTTPEKLLNPPHYNLYPPPLGGSENLVYPGVYYFKLEIRPPLSEKRVALRKRNPKLIVEPWDTAYSRPIQTS